MRNAAAGRGDSGLLSLWAGAGVARARSLLAAVLVKRLVEEVNNDAVAFGAKRGEETMKITVLLLGSLLIGEIAQATRQKHPNSPLHHPFSIHRRAGVCLFLQLI
jgi:hypothetical protein